jgi:hypothetical protein
LGQDHLTEFVTGGMPRRAEYIRNLHANLLCGESTPGNGRPSHAAA